MIKQPHFGKIIFDENRALDKILKTLKIEKRQNEKIVISLTNYTLCTGH